MPSPRFLFAMLLIVLFAGGSFVHWFPLRGLVSDNWRELSWPARDRATISGTSPCPSRPWSSAASPASTMLTKNSFLDEIHKQYVMTARAKGLAERRVLYGHVFRNAMLIVIAGFPGAFVEHPVHQFLAHRGDLLAGRARACSASRPPSTATIR